MRISDWSSDVCSSDLKEFALRLALLPGAHLDHFFHRHQNFAEAILHAGTRDALDQGALYLVFKPGKRVYHIPTLGHDPTLSLAQQRLHRRRDDPEIGRAHV